MRGTAGDFFPFFCPENGQKDPAMAVVHHRDEFSLIRGIFSDDAGKRLSVEF